MSEVEKNESKAKGGRARKAALSPEKRTEIAQKAAAARWSGDVAPPKATHTGELNIGDLSIQCAVLPDGRRLLSQRGVGRALGRSYGGADWKKREIDGGGNLPFYLGINALIPFISNDLLPLVMTPIQYFHGKGGGVAHGVDASALPQICDVWLKARDAGVLTEPQKIVAQKAEILIRGLAHIGIVALVDEATGYQAVRPKDALQAYLEQIISKELAAWVKKIPDEFYENIYKLRGWTWPGMGKNRYSIVGSYTLDLVYERIAPGLLPELKKQSAVDANGRRSHKLHQLLTDDIGNPMLSQHMHSLVMFQRLAIANGYGWKRFVKMVDQVLPKKGSNLEIPADIMDTDRGD